MAPFLSSLHWTLRGVFEPCGCALESSLLGLELRSACAPVAMMLTRVFINTTEKSEAESKLTISCVVGISGRHSCGYGQIGRKNRRKIIYRAVYKIFGVPDC